MAVHNRFKQQKNRATLDGDTIEAAGGADGEGRGSVWGWGGSVKGAARRQVVLEKGTPGKGVLDQALLKRGGSLYCSNRCFVELFSVALMHASPSNLTTSTDISQKYIHGNLHTRTLHPGDS